MSRRRGPTYVYWYGSRGRVRPPHGWTRIIGPLGVFDEPFDAARHQRVQSAMRRVERRASRRARRNGPADPNAGMRELQYRTEAWQDGAR